MFSKRRCFPAVARSDISSRETKKKKHFGEASFSNFVFFVTIP